MKVSRKEFDQMTPTEKERYYAEEMERRHARLLKEADDARYNALFEDDAEKDVPGWMVGGVSLGAAIAIIAILMSMV